MKIGVFTSSELQKDMRAKSYVPHKPSRHPVRFSTMIREDQYHALRELSAQTKMPISEITRLALDTYLLTSKG